MNIHQMEYEVLGAEGDAGEEITTPSPKPVALVPVKPSLNLKDVTAYLNRDTGPLPIVKWKIPVWMVLITGVGVGWLLPRGGVFLVGAGVGWFFGNRAAKG